MDEGNPIDELVARLAPVTPMPSNVRMATFFCLIVLASTSGAGVVWGIRTDLRTVILSPTFLVNTASLLVLSMCAMWAALAEIVPGSRQRFWSRWGWLLGGSAWIGGLLFAYVSAHAAGFPAGAEPATA